MKKVIVLLLVMCMLTASAGAEESLLTRAVELAERCDAVISDESYVSAMIGSGNSAIITMIKQWAAGDHTNPKLVVQVDTANLMDVFVQNYGQEWAASLREVGFDKIKRSLPHTIMSMLNASMGAETLAAASIATDSVVFASDVQGNGIFILYYEHAVPVAVTWYAENGAVSMQAIIIADENIAACRSAEDVAAALTEQGFELPCAVIQ